MMSVNWKSFINDKRNEWEYCLNFFPITYAAINEAADAIVPKLTPIAYSENHSAEPYYIPNKFVSLEYTEPACEYPPVMAFSTQRSFPSSSSLASSSSSTTPLTYDVFISFRGEDTRYGFTDHLYAAFEQRGFFLFKDDKKLEKGSSNEELFEAIKKSQYAVVVISKTFAHSTWCLKELNTIVECWERSGLEVLPVFYHVDPSDVRKQKGIFAEAFDEHSKDPNVDKEQREAWRAALTKVANISGWPAQNNSPEAIIVREITAKILCGLRGNPSKVFENLVGIESRVVQLISLLHLDEDDVRCIGIHGMGGVGKTTLAKALYDIVHCDFDAYSFICCSENNESCSVKGVQEQIIYDILKENNMKIWNSYCGTDVLRERLCNKKVFIILDDVNFEQLKVLLGKINFFGKGSRIVLTGRDCRFWKPIVSKIYEVPSLEDENALQLFCQKAFKKSYPEEDFAQLSTAIIRLVGGLPLALEVIGSFLFGMEIGVWNSALKVLETCPSNDVLGKLQISYDSLEDKQKKMFLDIACFFNGMSKMGIQPIFQSLDYHPDFHFEVLENKSLIKISQKEIIWMHDLLRKIGQRVIYQMSPNEPGNRSRLWCSKDFFHVMKYNSGTDAVEGIVFSYSSNLIPKNQPLSIEAFSKMRSLKILMLSGNTSVGGLKWVGNLSKLVLSNELRVLEWSAFPFKSLPTNFQPDNLVNLCLQYSKIETLQLGKKTFDRLKYIDLSNSCCLTKIEDLSGVPNLETLNLSSCYNLREIHPSLGTLENLSYLDVSHCRYLKRLPKKICWKSLEVLNLSCCLGLENLPDNVDSITSLRSLVLHSTCIKVPLWWMKSLSSLRGLRISELKQPFGHGFKGQFCQFVDLHSHTISCLKWLSSLTLLEYLSLSYRNLLDEDIPDFSNLPLLRDLDLAGNKFTKIPEGVGQHSHLKFLRLKDCKHLQFLLTSPPLGLSFLSLDLEGCNLLDETICNWFVLGSSSCTYSLSLSRNNFTTLPDNFRLFSRLDRLELDGCLQLSTLPKLPLSLWNLDIRNCPLLEIGCYHTGIRELELCSGLWFSMATNTGHEYDGTPYKILQPNPRYLVDREKVYNYYDGDMYAWGPTTGSEMPEWFNTNLCRVDVDSNKRIRAVALFVAYQVHEDEDSNCSISQNDNPTLPEFVCRFQELPLVFRVPEVPFVRQNGFWAYIPVGLFKKNRMDLVKRRYLETSIGTSYYSNVEVKECGIRLVYDHDVSQFFKVLGSITPPGLDLKGERDFRFVLQAGRGFGFELEARRDFSFE